MSDDPIKSVDSILSRLNEEGDWEYIGEIKAITGRISGTLNIETLEQEMKRLEDLSKRLPAILKVNARTLRLIESYAFKGSPTYQALCEITLEESEAVPDWKGVVLNKDREILGVADIVGESK